MGDHGAKISPFFGRSSLSAFSLFWAFSPCMLPKYCPFLGAHVAKISPFFGLYLELSFSFFTKENIALCLTFWLRQGAQGVTLSVCLSGTSLSKALNLHLSLIGQSQVSSQVSSQVVPRSLSGLSLLSSSEGQSLKYFVLLTEYSV